MIGQASLQKSLMPAYVIFLTIRTLRSEAKSCVCISNDGAYQLTEKAL